MAILLWCFNFSVLRVSLLFQLSFLLLFSLAHGGPCPEGYTQAPDWGYCYKTMAYYNIFIGQYTPKYYDDAEYDCRSSGGFLASIHTQEENEFIIGIKDNSRCSSTMGKNIGLKCVGKSCKWNDNSPVTYTNFDGAGPKDDGETRCYGFFDSYRNTWIEKYCDEKYTNDCWICSAKPKPIDCFDYETPYGMGCASVFTWPLDQKNAESFCPGGGYLASIHNNYDNSFYEQLALDAGVHGTIYIGGYFSNGKFEWDDGTSYDDAYQWATGFPNPVFGNCVQMLLDQAFGVYGTWSNVDCTVKQPYICFRDGHEIAPTLPTTSTADAHCPPIQSYTGSGSVYSPNYPLSIPSEQTCEYVLQSKEGTRASVIFHTFNCQSGTSLSLFDGLDTDQPFITFTTKSPPPNQAYTATANSLKIIFTANGASAPVGTGWEAEFTGK